MSAWCALLIMISVSIAISNCSGLASSSTKRFDGKNQLRFFFDFLFTLFFMPFIKAAPSSICLGMQMEVR